MLNRKLWYGTVYLIYIANVAIYIANYMPQIGKLRHKMTTGSYMCNKKKKKKKDLRLEYLIWQEETEAHHSFHSIRKTMLFLSLAI